MLKNIQIEGFKSIRKLELDLKTINILIGANGVGKSNFISFLKLINIIFEQGLEQYSLKEGVDNLLYFGRKYTNEIVGYLEFDSGNAYSFELAPTSVGTLFIPIERSIYYNTSLQPEYKHLDTKNLRESYIKDSPRARDEYLRKHLESYKVYHFHDTGITSPLRSRANINDNKLLRENGSNLPSYLYYLMQVFPKAFKRIEKTVASTAPFFKEFQLRPMALDPDYILLEWIEKDHEEMYFNATHLSDGSLRFIALATLLMQPNLPKVIIIDEPELGLHPSAINKLAGMIKSAAARGCQIIVSTQSVTLLNDFEPEDIVTVDREDNQSVFRRLDKLALSNWMEDYSLGELWTKSVIRGQAL